MRPPPPPPPFIVLFTYEHFKIEFSVIGLPIQPHKCVTFPLLAYCLILTPHFSLTPH